jgi:hypothetical protein
MRLLIIGLALASCAFGQTRNWVQLFNGKDLDGWTPKITRYPLGENFGNTFRVEDGVIKVSYDKYTHFAERFGHLFYKTKFSHYYLAVEYRFVGEQAPGGPAWALRNSGVMLHCQAPETMTRYQDFPISIEGQFLGGAATGVRTTSNLCTPGTEAFRNGTMIPGHCLNSTSETYRGDQWVRAEFEVNGSSIKHIIDGKVVLEYQQTQIGGGQVTHFDPAAKKDGTALTEGYISLQSESHPIEFRKVEIAEIRP